MEAEGKPRAMKHKAEPVKTHVPRRKVCRLLQVAGTHNPLPTQLLREPHEIGPQAEVTISQRLGRSSLEGAVLRHRELGLARH